LSVDTDVLLIETKDRYEGRFVIKNIGGSALAGRIHSRSRSLTFEPEEWTGNEVTVLYKFSPEPGDGWKPGDALDTSVIISSNGGEKKIPVTIRLTRMAIVSPEGVTVANIRDFYQYAIGHPAQARKMFIDSEFYMLLLATGYEYMEVYEMLHKDANRERALDNFFILSGLKKKTLLTIPNKLMEYTRKPSDIAMVYGNFMVQKSDGGYFEAPVTARHNAAWLSLSAERLITSDFNEANAAMVKFSIDPSKIKGRYVSETLIIGSDPEPDGSNLVELVYRRSAPLSAQLDREAFRFEDNGMLIIQNNTGSDLLVEIFCTDTFVRFAARKYYVSERGEIPFEIKLSAFMAAQLLFRKLPFLRTAIEVRALYRGETVRRKLPLVVGEW
jgi:hypothetical protein